MLLDEAKIKLDRCPLAPVPVLEDNKEEIHGIAEPLINSEALKRLSSISFLGILSPCYTLISDVSLISKRKHQSLRDPGSRLSHTLGVTRIALDYAKRLGFSEKTKAYVVAWGLLHDIATWPLSHTGEPAFSEITNVSSRKLREMMIMGSRDLPKSLTVNEQLHAMHVDPYLLLKLFSKEELNISPELEQFRSIVRSPVTPDALEGIWRSGWAYGISVPHPNDVQKALSRNLFNLVISSNQSETVIKFWRSKAKVYNDFINKHNIVCWESAWSSAIKLCFKHLSLNDTLLIPENEIITTLQNSGLPEFSKSRKVFRYKAPLSYFVYPQQRKKLKGDYPLPQLGRILKKKEKFDPDHENCEPRRDSQKFDALPE